MEISSQPQHQPLIEPIIFDGLFEPILFFADNASKGAEHSCKASASPTVSASAEQPPKNTEALPAAMPAASRSAPGQPRSEKVAPSFDAFKRGSGIDFDTPTTLATPSPATAYKTAAAWSKLMRRSTPYSQPATSTLSGEIVPSTQKKVVAPKPMYLAQKLLHLLQFAKFQGHLYLFIPSKGYFTILNSDEAREYIMLYLNSDLKIKGSASQLREILEFLRADPLIKICERPSSDLLCFPNGVLAAGGPWSSTLELMQSSFLLRASRSPILRALKVHRTFTVCSVISLAVILT